MPIGLVKMNGSPELTSMESPLALEDRLCFSTEYGEVVLTNLDGQQIWNDKRETLGEREPVVEQLSQLFRSIGTIDLRGFSVSRRWTGKLPTKART